MKEASLEHGRGKVSRGAGVLIEPRFIGQKRSIRF